MTRPLMKSSGTSRTWDSGPETLLIVWYDMHHFQGFDSHEAVDFRTRLKAICGAARGVGLDVGFACVANEGYA